MISRLAGHQADDLRRSLEEVAHREGLRNVFNPSPLVDGGRVHIAFRALPIGASKPFRGYIATGSPHDATPWTLTDLTEAAGAAVSGPVADPKLFAAHGAVYATFNTGYVSRSGGENAVYVMRVAPSVGPPQVCLLEGRHRIEKNWAFRGDGPDLAGAYWVDPLGELVQTRGTVGTGDPLIFRAVWRGVGRTFPGRTLTMGSQLLGERPLLIVHERYDFRGKRLYVGRLAEISDIGTAQAAVRVSRRALVHSFRSMLPFGARHNPNLMSATYFSGLTELDGRLLLGYGINDLAFGMAAVEERSLWT